MATAELDHRAGAARSARCFRRTWLFAYTTIWAMTLGIALVVAVGGAHLQTAVAAVIGAHLDPQLNPPPQVGRVLALAAHNLPIEAWPVLLGVVGAHRHPLARRAADVLVGACMTVNVGVVGSALGAYGLALVPYLPQLPLEWAGLALGTSCWLVQRQRALTPREGVACVTLIACALLGAAALETVAVPHR
jgi:hypothetical protein